MSAPTKIKIGAWVVSPALNLVERGHESTKLESRTMDVLVYLASRPGEVVSVDDLLTCVWRGVVVGESSVYRAIKQLRHALPAEDGGASYIETIPKRGYRLLAPVESVPPSPAAANPPSIAPAAHATAPGRGAGKWLAPVLGLAAVAALAVSAGRWSAAPETGRAPAPIASRFMLAVPDLADAHALSVSPDGRNLAYVAGAAGRELLYVRARDAFEARALPGTEGATMPFWSPDSRELGFRAGSELKRVALVGGEPRRIADVAGAPFGTATWSSNGDILFDGGTGIERVPADGGTPQEVTTLAPGEGGHVLPAFLPDGRRFFFTSGFKEPRSVYVQTLGSAERARVSSGGALAAYASGYLLLNAPDGTLTAQPFDLDRLETRGEPVRLANDAASFSVSTNGVLAYVVRRAVPLKAPAQRTQLAWYDRRGKRLGTIGEPAAYRGIALSPDGRYLAAHLHEGNDTGDIWVLDLVQKTPATKRTLNRAHNLEPVWSPDGSRILFTGANFNLYQTAASGDGVERPLLDSLRFAFASDWSRDGKTVLVTYVPETANQVDIAAVALDGLGVTPVVSTPFDEGGAKLSPDGRTVAYTSNESGRTEVYVRSYPQAATAVRVAPGVAPLWSRDGRELFYLKDDGTLMAVAIAANEHGLAVQAPRALFTASFARGDHDSAIGELFHVPYDVAPDGERFVVNERIDGPPPDRRAERAGMIAVVLDWTSGLENAR